MENLRGDEWKMAASENICYSRGRLAVYFQFEVSEVGLNTAIRAKCCYFYIGQLSVNASNLELVCFEIHLSR